MTLLLLLYLSWVKTGVPNGSYQNVAVLHFLALGVVNLKANN